MIPSDAYRMAELDEVIGELHSIKKTEIGMVALISKVHVLLPEELAGKLSSLIGKRIGILRCDGYRFRILNDRI